MIIKEVVCLGSGNEILCMHEKKLFRRNVRVLNECALLACFTGKVGSRQLLTCDHGNVEVCDFFQHGKRGYQERALAA